MNACRQGPASLSNGDTAGSTGLGGLGEAPYANLTQLHKAQRVGGGNFSIQNEAEFPALPGTSEQHGSEDGQGNAPGQQQPQQQQQQVLTNCRNCSPSPDQLLSMLCMKGLALALA